MGMMDLRERKSLHEEDMSENNKKCCTDCKTTKTPLWRGGPAGPKSLCNACGIRYRKKRRAMMPLNNRPEKKRERSHTTTTITNNNNNNNKITTSTTSSTTNIVNTIVASKGPDGNNGLSESLKMRLMFLGNEVLLQRSSTIVKKQRCQRRRKLGEEEQAAFCLMALSCGSVFA